MLCDFFILPKGGDEEGERDAIEGISFFWVGRRGCHFWRGSGGEGLGVDGVEVTWRGVASAFSSVYSV